jgi:hypothetical protein
MGETSPWKMSLITLQDGQWLTAELLPIFKVDGSDGQMVPMSSGGS